MHVFDRFRRKPQLNLNTKPVEIGDGALTVDVPEQFTTRREQDLATVVFDPNFPDRVVQFTVVHVDKQNPAARGLGIRFIHDSAWKRHARILKDGDKHYYSYVEPAYQGGEEAYTRYWVAGLDNAVLVATCWMKVKETDSPGLRDLISSIEPAILSLRVTKFPKQPSEESFKPEFLELSAEHAAKLNVWRDAAYKAASSFSGRPGFTGNDGDLRAIQVVLDNGALAKLDGFALEGLGILFGDILARKLDLHWITIQDSHSRIPGLRYRQSGIVLTAADMLARRVQRGESVAVVPLFNALVQQIRTMIATEKG
ncbi:MAG: DUF3806 domain-containing protein [Chloroflexi bacterium]|nr:DUF3806 domain-containing protein [Chloroflexota bacterium]